MPSLNYFEVSGRVIKNGGIVMKKNIGKNLLAILTTSLLITGCGSSDSANYSVNGGYYNGLTADEVVYDSDYMTESSEMEMGDKGLSGSTVTGSGDSNSGTNTSDTNKLKMSQEKMIYRTHIEAETLNFDTTYADLKALLNKYDCVISNESISNDGRSYMNSGYRSSRNGYTTEREAYIEIRVPVANYFGLLESVEAIGNITSKDSSATNITRSYYDTKAELEAYEEEYAQLEKLLDMAQEMSDVLVITDQMTNVRSRINKLNSSLQNMDLDVAYSFIYLTLTEVVEYTQPEYGRSQKTFWDRFKNNFEDTYEGFLDFLEGMLFFIIRIIPYAVLIAIVMFIYRKTPLYRWFKKKSEAKRARKLEEKAYIQSGGKMKMSTDSMFNGNDDSKKEDKK